MDNKFAVLIPVCTQVGFDTWKDSYKTLIVSNKLNLDEIMAEVHKHSKDAKLEALHFTTIIESEQSPNK